MKIILKNVPYYSQWESPELVKEIISGKLSAKKDPRWKESGATNLNEYLFWSKNSCGMACLKMILAHKLKVIIPIVQLGKKCLHYGGYLKKGKELNGLIYQPFTDFINKEFGLKSKVFSQLFFLEIIQELKKGNYVIASVHKEIRNPSTSPVQKGGHLILILGFNDSKKIFYFHNPSGTNKKNQIYSQISYVNFTKFFAKRGIVVEN